MLNQILFATTGFSIVALILLIVQKRTESPISKLLANCLLCGLIGIQLLHGLYITDYILLKDVTIFVYLLLLGFVGPVFYLYSQHVIDTNKKWSWLESGHFLLVILIAFGGYLYPEHFNYAYSLLFLIGGLYMGRLAWLLYQLRVRRTLFKMEFLFTAVFLSWAIAVVFIGMFSGQAMDFLIPIQTIMLAMAIAAALHIQLNYPCNPPIYNRS